MSTVKNEIVVLSEEQKQIVLSETMQYRAEYGDRFAMLKKLTDDDFKPLEALIYSYLLLRKGNSAFAETNLKRLVSVSGKTWRDSSKNTVIETMKNLVYRNDIRVFKEDYSRTKIEVFDLNELKQNRDGTEYKIAVNSKINTDEPFVQMFLRDFERLTFTMAKVKGCKVENLYACYYAVVDCINADRGNHLQVAWIGYKKIAKRVNLSIPTVEKCMKALVAYGILYCRKRHSDDMGQMHLYSRFEDWDDVDSALMSFPKGVIDTRRVVAIKHDSQAKFKQNPKDESYYVTEYPTSIQSKLESMGVVLRGSKIQKFKSEFIDVYGEAVLLEWINRQNFANAKNISGLFIATIEKSHEKLQDIKYKAERQEQSLDKIEVKVPTVNYDEQYKNRKKERERNQQEVKEKTFDLFSDDFKNLFANV